MPLRKISKLAGHRRGAVLLEFALLAPWLFMLVFGLIAYGQYFLLAHSAQQLANDAARATIAGLSPQERASLAQQTVAREALALPEAASRQVTTLVEETSDLVTVRVRVDASALVLMRMAWLPLPSPMIDRRAVMRPGGTA